MTPGPRLLAIGMNALSAATRLNSQGITSAALEGWKTSALAAAAGGPF